MEGSSFDEIAFFRTLAASGVRSLLIGRRALVVLGLPVLTADYDLWVHPEDAGKLNGLAEPFGLFPTHTPEEARGRGRYSLQNDEMVNVLLARSVTTVDGVVVRFDDCWARRRAESLEPRGVATVALPALEDLILTKRFAARPKDLEDIRLLEALRKEEGQ